ncbi:MAG TPA: DUF6113 family protein [Frankiaceae bacterium]|nr:DUF6113 family protein [Frankiaceae bacterium]
MNPRRAVTISLVVVGTFLGVLIAVVTAFHVPTGTGLASLGVALTALLLGPYAHLLGVTLRSSGAAALPCVAWLVTTMLLASTRPEGDLVVTGSAEGLAFLLVGTVSAAVGIGTVRSGIARSDRRAADRAATRDVSPNGSSEAPIGR